MIKPGPETGRTLAWKAMVATAKVAQEQGDPEQAESLYKRAIENCEKRMGPDDVAIASILMELADLYDEQGAREKAEPLHTRVRTILAQYAKDLLD
jgi:tetratricopeptide (TPR) repeat protein